MAVRYEIAVGLNKGNKTTKIRRVSYKGDKKVKGLKGSSVKNVSYNGRTWCCVAFVMYRSITSNQN